VLTAAPPADPAGTPAPRGGHGQAERRRIVAIGQRIGWTLQDIRICCGIWAGSRRISCPMSAELPDSTDPQCPACAAADRGKALARDAIPDDGRTYGLYLAWFGPGLLKIGLTAASRGRDRLLEQGAITYTLLAAGRYPVIRRAERLIAAAGLARERIPARAKSAAWWDLPSLADRAAALTAGRAQITGQVTWPGGLEQAPGPVIDQAADFGLDQAPPGSWDEVTAVTGGARLAGELTAIIGRQLLLRTATRSLLIDMRRVAGWAFTASAAGDTGLAAAGLPVTPRTRPKEPHDDQRTLF
jgi:Protein of unknown function (DUF2797)